jgi:hypothetical protein
VESDGTAPQARTLLRGDQLNHYCGMFLQMTCNQLFQRIFWRFCGDVIRSARHDP